jgi:hypothetical protein
MSDTQIPELETVIAGALAAHMKNVDVAMPARVESYDPATQSCSVQFLQPRGVKDETGARQAERKPVATGVPVVFPGSGGYSITWPISKGDTVLIIVASESIDRWLALGGEVDPVDDRRHHLTDAIAIPGLRDFAHAITPAPSSTAMVISANDLRLGDASAVVLALKSDVQALRDYVNNNFCAVGGHTHAVSGAATTSIVTVGSAGGTPPSVIPSNPTGTTKTKAS